MISDCLPAGSLVLSFQVWTWTGTTLLAILGVQLANCRSRDFSASIAV